MPKGKKKGKTGKSGKTGKTGKKKAARSSSGSPKRGKSKGKKKVVVERPPIDVLSPAAAVNAYYVCHNVADCLTARGFAWPGAKKKKKKGKKKKK